MSDKFLTIDEILEAPDLIEEELIISEWGGKVKIKSLSRDQVHQILEQSKSGGQLDNKRLETLALIASITEPKFTDEHVERLQQKASAPIQKIIERVMAISGLKENALKEAEATFLAKR